MLGNTSLTGRDRVGETALLLLRVVGTRRFRDAVVAWNGCQLARNMGFICLDSVVCVTQYRR